MTFSLVLSASWLQNLPILHTKAQGYKVFTFQYGLFLGS